MLSTSLAKKIIREVKSFINEDLIMVDTAGTIIASTVPSRLGHFHEGALLVANEKQARVITKADESTIQGVKAGINLPLFHHNKVVGIIGITGTPETVLPYGELIKKMTELLIQESHYQAQFEWEARSLETFVFDWILMNEVSTSLRKRAEVLEVNMEIPRQVVLMEIQGETSLFKIKRWTLPEHEMELKKEDILVQWGQNRMILLLANDSREEGKASISPLPYIKRIQQHLEGYFDVPIFIGIGKLHTNALIKKSYQEADRALKACTPDMPLVLEEELRLEMVIQAIPSYIKEEFSYRLLYRILKENGLQETIQVYFANHLSLKETAVQLNIHINTLHYRLRKVESLTNLQLKSVHDLTTLYLALLFLEETTK